MTETSNKIKRLNVPTIDEILGVKFSVLDDGFVRVVDYMGSDAAIVQAARISYGSGTKKVHEDRGLIRYLMRHRHTTPFEMCEIKFHVRVPMDCWRQWIRHRTANVNEYSTRYSEAIDATQTTAPDHWRLQAGTNRQGSGAGLPTDVGRRLTAREAEIHNLSRDLYQERLTVGVAREQARKDLPLSTYTEAYWKIDLHNLFHFLSLRMDTHAQFEIRSYADIIGREVVSRWCPVAWEAFVDYRLEALMFSGIEARILSSMVSGDSATAMRLAEDAGWLPRNAEGKLSRSRERLELEKKLSELGVSIPWESTEGQ
jgi:thymidylate synthase (FAD)